MDSESEEDLEEVAGGGGSQMNRRVLALTLVLTQAANVAGWLARHGGEETFSNGLQLLLHIVGLVMAIAFWDKVSR